MKRTKNFNFLATNKKKILQSFILVAFVVVAWVFVYLNIFRHNKNDNPVAGFDDNRSTWQEIFNIIPDLNSDEAKLSLLERQNILRQQEQKLALDQIKLNSLPKYIRTTFFLKTPIFGSLSLPSTWEGQYKTVESDNLITFFCSTQFISSPLFSISQEVSGKESIKSQDKAVWRLLSDVLEYKFYIQINNTDTLPGECQKMANDIDLIVKSFKSQKN